MVDVMHGSEFYSQSFSEIISHSESSMYHPQRDHLQALLPPSCPGYIPATHSPVTALLITTRLSLESTLRLIGHHCKLNQSLYVALFTGHSTTRCLHVDWLVGGTC